MVQMGSNVGSNWFKGQDAVILSAFLPLWDAGKRLVAQKLQLVEGGEVTAVEHTFPDEA